MKKKGKNVRKRRKLRIDRIIILVLVVGGLALGGYFLVDKVLVKKSNSDKEVKEEEPKKEVEREDTLSLVMIGDNLIHSSVYYDANKNAGYNGYDFKPMITYIKDKVQDYDLAYYNQETILGGTEIGLSDYPAFNSPYEAGDAMIDAGFNLVSLATNHTIDRGEQAVINSCNYWKQHEDVLAVGSYCSFEDRDAIQIREKNNITYTMLNYTYGTNGIPVPSGKEYLVNVWPMDNGAGYGVGYEGYKEQVKEDIEKVRDKVDVLIVAMHWGVEYTHVPTSYQRDAAEYLASLGVDIIIGTHPHVIQPVTWIGDTLVVYSLGNFLSAQETSDDYNKMVGLMSSVKITKKTKGDDVSISLSDVNNELLFTYYSGWRNFKVVPFSSPDIGNYNYDYQRLYNKYSAVVKNMDESMPVVALSGE